MSCILGILDGTFSAGPLAVLKKIIIVLLEYFLSDNFLAYACDVITKLSGYPCNVLVLFFDLSLN